MIKLSTLDEIKKCNGCGYCQATCPLYNVTFKETAVARGHNARMKFILQQNSVPVWEDKDNFFDCLLCRRCIESCLPGVRTDEVVIAARNAWRLKYGYNLQEKFILKGLISHPVLISLLAKSTSLTNKFGLIKGLKIIGLAHRYPLLNFAELIQTKPAKNYTHEVIQIINENSKEKPALYFWGCGIKFLPEIKEAT